MIERGGRLFDDRPVRRVRAHADASWAADAWPASITVVAQVLGDGLEPARGVTFLVGENGSGKSTLVEGIATAYGLPPEGGSNQGSHVTRPSGSPLGGWLQLKWLANLNEMVGRGTQVLCATHSPILASLAGARLLETGEWEIRKSGWEELEIVRHWRSYLEAPGRYLCHLL